MKQDKFAICTHVVNCVVTTQLDTMLAHRLITVLQTTAITTLIKLPNSQ